MKETRSSCGNLKANNGKLRIFFPFIFIGMWVLVTFIISKMGWADLVAKYQSSAAFAGQRVGVTSVSINSATYRNSLLLKYNEDGMYLRPIFLFRLFHKPIFIPWKEIKEIREKKILFFSLKELIIGQPFVAIVTLKKTVFAKIEDNLRELIQ